MIIYDDICLYMIIYDHIVSAAGAGAAAAVLKPPNPSADSTICISMSM